MESVVINPSMPAKAAVIWLHGLGADGHDFAPIVPGFGLSSQLAVRFLFPHAPFRNVTLNGGYRQRAWFDITSLDLHKIDSDIQGVHAARDRIVTLIEEQIRQGIPSTRIVIAGFSQGGGLALYTGLTCDRPLAGILGLSTFLPLQAELANKITPANQSTPIFLTHGRQDTLLPLQWGKLSAETLQKLHCKVDFKVYDMAHEVCRQEVADIGAWLNQRLA